MKTLQQILAAALLCLAVTTSFAADAASGRGVVNRIDAANGIVNIHHEPIAALKWPTMSMDFRVVNRQQLSALKAGQTVSFKLIPDAALGYVISHVEPAKK